MTRDYRRNVPTVLPDFDPGTNPGDGIPYVPRNPLISIFQRMGDDAARRALDSRAKVAAALTGLLDEQTKAVEANGRYHAAVEKFHANRLGLLNPADKQQFEEEHHARMVAKWRREKELLDAEQQMLESQHKLEATAAFRDQKFAAGRARFAHKIAEHEVGEAVARSSMEPEPNETQTPEKPASIVAVLADHAQKLEREIDAAEAAGRPTKQMRDELAAVNALLQRM